jgi:hypothetical protein
MLAPHDTPSPPTPTPPMHSALLPIRAALRIGGVILPLLALALLASAAWLADMTVPASFVVHLGLIASIALANAMLARARRGAAPALVLLHGLASGASAAYAMLFLPLALAGLASAGACAPALLPVALTSLLVLAATLAARRLYRQRLRHGGGAALAPAWPGVLLALALVGMLELPSAITRVGMRMATEPAAGVSANGIGLLRYLGNERTILRACYDEQREAADLTRMVLAMSGQPDIEDARAIYYRLTGMPFSAMPQPLGDASHPWRIYDADSASPQVGARVANLHLAASRMDGMIDARAALGALEWTMVLRNVADNIDEARARIIVPAGAVVTQVTLWDEDGAHRLAGADGPAAPAPAPGQPGTERAPVLLSTAGKDRFMLHVPMIRGQGEVTLRIALSAPLVLNEPALGYLQLPSFSERNFGIAPALRHAVSLQSASALRAAPGMREEAGSALAFAVRGELAEPLAGMGAPIVGALRSAADTHAWSLDPATPGGAIVQTIVQQAARIPRRVALVIDGSATLAAQREQLARAATSFPGNVELGLVVAGAQPPQVFLHDPSDSLASVRYLQDIAYQGGHDNSAALLAAWEWAAASSDGALVWIHGPQPLLPGSADALLQHYRQHPTRVRIVDLEAVTGPNLLLEKMDGLAMLASLPRIGSLHDDLVRLLTGWKPAAQQVVVTRSRASALQPPREQVSTQLTRLWAGERAAPLRAQGDQATAAQSRELLDLDALLAATVDGSVSAPAPLIESLAAPLPAEADSGGELPPALAWSMLGAALAVPGWRLCCHRRRPHG